MLVMVVYECIAGVGAGTGGMCVIVHEVGGDGDGGVWVYSR